MSRLYPERPFLAASVAVFREGRVLLAQRAKGAGAGNYSLPGGMVETGERMSETCLRELTEETGVTAELVGFVDHVEVIHREADGRVRTHAAVAVFAAHWISGDGETSDEASDIVWTDPLKPADLPMTAGLREVLARAARIAGVAGSAA
jgi:8-oxo-dGTP diphosphatase